MNHQSSTQAFRSHWAVLHLFILTQGFETLWKSSGCFIMAKRHTFIIFNFDFLFSYSWVLSLSLLLQSCRCCARRDVGALHFQLLVGASASWRIKLEELSREVGDLRERCALFVRRLWLHQPLHDAVLLLASVARLIHIVVAVALVVLGQRVAVVFAQLLQGPRSHDHLVETRGLGLWAVEDVRCVLIEHDGLLHHVLGLVRILG